jgi:hypothetical protein
VWVQYTNSGIVRQGMLMTRILCAKWKVLMIVDILNHIVSISVRRSGWVEEVVGLSAVFVTF